jgi:hypothetical protein
LIREEFEILILQFGTSRWGICSAPWRNLLQS